MTTHALLAPVSIGEVIDKITILEIKSERIKNAEKLRNIRRELSVLMDVVENSGIDVNEIISLKGQLKTVNERLWEIEDAIRIKENLSEFDAAFIELARSVYRENDQRAALKREINLNLGSDLVEEKSYADYNAS